MADERSRWSVRSTKLRATLVLGRVLRRRTSRKTHELLRGCNPSFLLNHDVDKVQRPPYDNTMVSSPE